MTEFIKMMKYISINAILCKCYVFYYLISYGALQDAICEFMSMLYKHAMTKTSTSQTLK